MERLITWTQHGPKIKGFCMVEHDFDLTECRILGNVASRLARYEDSGLSPEEVQELAKAKAEGRLVVLLCKVGDTVFVGSLFGRKINEYTVTGIKFDHEGCLLYVGGAYKRAEKVFLAREEAEKALGGGGDA